MRILNSDWFSNQIKKHAHVEIANRSSIPVSVPDQHARLAYGVVALTGRAATLDDIPDAELDRLAGMGSDWIWLLSVWHLFVNDRSAEDNTRPRCIQALTEEQF